MFYSYNKILYLFYIFLIFLRYTSLFFLFYFTDSVIHRGKSAADPDDDRDDTDSKANKTADSQGNSQQPDDKYIP